jgi:hypothetical protein
MIRVSDSFYLATSCQYGHRRQFLAEFDSFLIDCYESQATCRLSELSALDANASGPRLPPSGPVTHRTD